MKTLNCVSTKYVNKLTWPASQENTSLYSPALEVFTDFNVSAPRVIESNTRADELVRLMRKEHVRMKLVVDANNNFQGVVSLEDLAEEVFIKQIADGYARSELLVADLMRPKEKLFALSYASLRKSDIESLLYSQRDNVQQHLLVVEDVSQVICGLISSSDIARQLRLDIDINLSSFANIYQVALLQSTDKRQVA